MQDCLCVLWLFSPGDRVYVLCTLLFSWQLMVITFYCSSLLPRRAVGKEGEELPSWVNSTELGCNKTVIPSARHCIYKESICQVWGILSATRSFSHFSLLSMSFIYFLFFFSVPPRSVPIYQCAVESKWSCMRFCFVWNWILPVKTVFKIFVKKCSSFKVVQSLLGKNIVIHVH